MRSARHYLTWLITEWSRASLLVAVFLVLLLPLWWSAKGLALALVFVQLPIYLIHQGEEHIGDRFRQFVNQQMAAGRSALTPAATLWINLLGVWVVDLGALYLATYVGLAYGLIAAYVTVVNALGHVGAAIMLRSYNPGLVTSLGLFLPIGGWAIATVSEQAGADWRYHLLAAGFALVSHAGLVVYMRWRVAQLNAHGAPRAASS